jgi:hypothetical protein
MIAPFLDQFIETGVQKKLDDANPIDSQAQT